MNESPAIVHGIGPKAALKDASNRPGATMPQRFRNSGNADGTGLCVIKVPGPTEGFYWMIGRIVVDSANGTCEVYTGDFNDPLNLVDYTNNANKAVADESTPVYVPTGVDVYFVFRGVVANGLCKVTGQYENRVTG